ncbi:G1/S-specific cyclin-E1 [Pleodorina starrii]|nr:G1/S-specific cyclin-E1 [Pleodorina starrii]
MQLSAARQSCGARTRAPQPRAAGVRPVHAARVLVNRRRIVSRAAEDAPAEAAEAPALSPLDRAKKALEDGSLDKEELTSCLAGLESEMERLRSAASAADERASALESTVSNMKDQYVRLTADFENFRRRTREENAQLTDNVRGDVIKELLPIVDNFELARTQVKTETEGEAKINNSYQGLYKQMVDMMRSLGVEAVPTTGTPFDPNIHDAIMREPSSSHPDGTVLQEFRKGFSIGGKLVRPAMVKVSYTEEGPANSSEE